MRSGTFCDRIGALLPSRGSRIGGVLGRDGRRNRRAEVADYGEAMVTRVPFADARRLFMAHDRGASALVGGGPGYET
jgi:hypothetical protein